jgi:hypothetical protein
MEFWRNQTANILENRLELHEPILTAPYRSLILSYYMGCITHLVLYLMTPVAREFVIHEFWSSNSWRAMVMLKEPSLRQVIASELCLKLLSVFTSDQASCLLLPYRAASTEDGFTQWIQLKLFATLSAQIQNFFFGEITTMILVIHRMKSK